MCEPNEKMMERALFLAEKGRFSVSPNPMVGAVIVYDGKIIGEGYHQQFGEAHAEVNAINSVKNKELLSKSCLYINLEPCAHQGKTPPCVDLILQLNIPKVVIANTDPNEKVKGKSIEKLKKNGVEVISGVLEKEGKKLNCRFLTFHNKKRPYIILKWAETTDGFIGRDPNDPNKNDSWISSAASKQLVHLWRAAEDGILIGKNTALIDNPSLTCREVNGKNPIRILIDRKLKLPKDLQVFDKKAETIIFNESKTEKVRNLTYIKISFENQKTVVKELLDQLYQLKIQSIIVEGGRQTLQAFIDCQLWDEVRKFVGQKKFSSGVSAPSFYGKEVSRENIQGDRLIIYCLQ